MLQDYEVLGPNCITFCRHMCSRAFDLHFEGWEQRLISERDYRLQSVGQLSLSGIEV